MALQLSDLGVATAYGILHFLIGAAGALLVVYATKRQIPEFRHFYDTDKEVEEIERLKEMRDENLQARTTAAHEGSPGPDKLDALYDDLTSRLTGLEEVVRRRTTWSRVMGVSAYVVLGGVVAALVVAFLPLSAAETGTPREIYAFVVGSAWTTFLAALGLKHVRDEAVDEIKDVTESAEETIRGLQKDLEVAIAAAKSAALTEVREGRVAADGAHAATEQAALRARSHEAIRELRTRRRAFTRRIRSL